MWVQFGPAAWRSTAPLPISGSTTEYVAGTVVSMTSSCPFWKLVAVADGSSMVVKRTCSRSGLSPHQFSSGSTRTVLLAASILPILNGPAVTRGSACQPALNASADSASESGMTAARPIQSAYFSLKVTTAIRSLSPCSIFSTLL